MQVLYEANAVGGGNLRAPTVVCRGRCLYAGSRIVDYGLAALGGLTASACPKSDCLLLDSRVVTGVLDKNVVGNARGMLVHHVFLAVGHEAAGKFIHRL
jgi:hypothetical protein